jgi:uncharacterized membrane protein
VLVRKAAAEEVLEGLKAEGGTVMKATLDHARKAAIRGWRSAPLSHAFEEDAP